METEINDIEKNIMELTSDESITKKLSKMDVNDNSNEEEFNDIELSPNENTEKTEDDMGKNESENNVEADKKDGKIIFRYFTPKEVSEHNTCDDLWVSWLGYVYDLTPLALEHRGDILMNPIIKNAGKDISHWFDKTTRNIKMHMNPKLGCMCPYTPDGRYVHVSPPIPYANWRPMVDKPWWEDDKYCIGKLSQKTRKIRIVNTLTKDEHIIEVCSEESLNAIQDRYLKLNAHAKGYMWKRLGNLLDMNKTLEENNIKDESKQFEMLGMDEDEYLPVIHVYFSDDLSIA